MSKRKKKKVVVTTSNKEAVKSTISTRKKKQIAGFEEKELLFGKQNFIWMLAGIGLIALGLLLMSGGKMPSRDVWDENLIYSTTRTLIAPIVILAGLVIQFFAIFRNNK